VRVGYLVSVVGDDLVSIVGLVAFFPLTLDLEFCTQVFELRVVERVFGTTLHLLVATPFDSSVTRSVESDKYLLETLWEAQTPHYR